MKFFRKLEFRFGAVAPRGIMTYLTAMYAAGFVISIMRPDIYFTYLSLNAEKILSGQVWRLVTFAFIPPSTDVLAFIAVYFYYWIGSTLEQYWGTAQFNVYFFSGLLLTVLYGFIIYFVTGLSIGVTAEYVYLSMFFSFAAMFPDMQVLLFFIIPIKMKWLALVDAAFFILQLISKPFPINLLPLVAILNFFIFCGGELLRKRPRKPSAEAVNFRRESRRIRQEQEAKLYNHKCAVCGKTDRDYPNLEFRYCSRCQGYHCFCQEHINSHVHFTE